ncbi:DNA helicase [Kocuria dechangensis]|uniref:DNA helicase n=1 Tax=Kocuria dechangensis TaxID=1176249 RepID=A0A917GEK3_9MICC|nr:DEAD/DEAH box helicase [Kocuria dechangensis]GGG42387.1 DNA helicase [Kocuria dechangensis]
MHSPPGPFVDSSRLVAAAGPAVYQRGQEYNRSGRVRSVQWSPGADGTGRLTAEVEGSGAVYSVSVRLGAGGVPGPAWCSCPAGGFCKHAVAAVLRNNFETAVLAHRAGGSAAPALRPGQDREAPGAPDWKDALSRILGGAPGPGLPEAEETGGAGLEFDLRREPFRHVHGRPGSGRPAAPWHVYVRPVRRGRRGQWIKGGLDWERVTGDASASLTPAQVDWFDELRALSATRSPYVVHDRHWIRLDSYASPLLWGILARAEDAGISLVGREHGLPVTVDEPGRFSVDVVRGAGEALQLRPTVDSGGRRVALATARIIGDPGHGLFHPDGDPQAVADTEDLNVFPLRLVPLATRLTREQRRFLDTAGGLTIPENEVDEFFDRYFPRLRRSMDIGNGDGSIELPQVADPELVLVLEHQDLTIRVRWEWEYQRGRDRVRLPFRPLDPLADEPVDRESSWETAVAAAVQHRAPGIDLRRSTYVAGDALVLVREWLPELEKVQDLRIEHTGTRPAYREISAPPTITVSTAATERRDWFDLGVTVKVGEFYIPFADVFRALDLGQDVMLTPDGSWFALDRPEFDRLRELIAEARSLQDGPEGPLRIHRHQAGLWQDLEDLATDTDQAEAWRTGVRALLDLAAPGRGGTGDAAGDAGGTSGDAPVAAAAVPATLHAELRPYQRDGYSWLAFLWDHGLGGILADDMGLGKTVQAIALICHALERDPGLPPFLVVAPTSVVPNWVTEIHRFAPSLVVAGVTDTQAKAGTELARTAAGAHVVVTSYTLLRLDEAAYRGTTWAGVLLDEAQFVKNPRTKAHRAVKEIDAPFKLAITGTPLENSLTELWALLTLTAPGLFPSRRKFSESYQRPIERGEDAEALARLRRRVKPLMLRRTKESVDLDLPPKLEQTIEVELSPAHRRIYDTRLQRERQKVLGLLRDLDRNRFTIFQSLTTLRLLSLDASLVDPEADVSSSKLDLLFEHLPEIVAEGHRPLVFSQFTSFLKKAAARLDELRIPYAYLDGSTTDRARVLERFTSGEVPVFLVSLKAGGFGLNLTQADYCFLLDPWWNPATEEQAVDRTHRIGQQKKVMVYRLVAKDTIEEKVMELKERKARLFAAVLDDDRMFSGALTAEDIRGLLEP